MVVSAIDKDLQGAVGVAECAKAADEAIETSYYPESVQEQMNGFNFGNVSALVSRIKVSYSSRLR